MHSILLSPNVSYVLQQLFNHAIDINNNFIGQKKTSEHYTYSNKLVTRYQVRVRLVAEFGDEQRGFGGEEVNFRGVETDVVSFCMRTVGVLEFGNILSR